MACFWLLAAMLNGAIRVDRPVRAEESPTLGVLGAADAVSMVIRIALVQLATPDAMRGRVGAVNFLFVDASYRLGGFESGVTAAALGAVPAVVLGGIGTVAVALLWMKLFPTLRAVDRLE
jgi:hypothetical protein